MAFVTGQKATSSEKSPAANSPTKATTIEMSTQTEYDDVPLLRGEAPVVIDVLKLGMSSPQIIAEAFATPSKLPLASSYATGVTPGVTAPPFPSSSGTVRTLETSNSWGTSRAPTMMTLTPMDGIAQQQQQQHKQQQQHYQQQQHQQQEQPPQPPLLPPQQQQQQPVKPPRGNEKSSRRSR